MAREEYRRIVRTFWTDPDVKRKLTLEQKAVLLYFFTSPHSNMIGLYYCPLAYVSAEIELPVEEVRKHVVGPLSRFLTYDETTEEVFVHALAKHNIGDRLHVGVDKLTGDPKPDNRIPASRRFVEAIHSLRLKRAFLQRYGDSYSLGLPVPAPEAPSELLPSPLASSFEAKAVHSTAEHNVSVPSEPASRFGDSVQEAQDPSMTERQVLWAVRRVLWGPDGKPPADWSEGREVSVIRALATRGESHEDLVRAVHGLKILQEQGELTWLVPNTKVTLRAVYNSKNGSRDMLTQALDAYASGPRQRELGRKSSQQTVEMKRADFMRAANQPHRGMPPIHG